MTVSIDLAWQDNASTEDNYIVERREVEKVAIMSDFVDRFTVPPSAQIDPAGASKITLVYDFAWDEAAYDSTKNIAQMDSQWRTRANGVGRWDYDVTNEAGTGRNLRGEGAALNPAPYQRKLLRVDVEWLGGSSAADTYESTDGGETWGLVSRRTSTGGSGFNAATSELRIGNQGRVLHLYYFAYYIGDFDPANLVAEFSPSQASGYGTGESWTDNLGNVWSAEGNARIDAVNTLVYDTFTDANGTLMTAHTPEVGGSWTAQAEVTTVQIQNNQATNLSTSSNGINMYAIDVGESDVVLEAECVSIHESGANNNNNHSVMSLFVRCATYSSDTWQVYQGKTTGINNVPLGLYERDGGSFVQRANVDRTIVSGVPYKVWVSAEGNTITVWDDVSAGPYSISYTGADPANLGTNVGYYVIYDPTAASPAYWENFKATTIAAADNGAGWEVLTDTLPADTEVYEDFTALAGKRYAYRVACKNVSEVSPYSNEIEVIT